MTRDLTTSHALLPNATSQSTAIVIGSADTGNKRSKLTGGTPSQVDEWIVAHVGVENRKVHVLRLVSQPTRNPFAKLAIELGFSSASRMVGRLLSPARLKPSDGVRLWVDSVHPLGEFSLAPAGNKKAIGSIVKLDFDRSGIQRLCEGKALNISASGASNGKPVQFSVPLVGFSTCVDQLLTLQNLQ